MHCLLFVQYLQIGWSMSWRWPPVNRLFCMTRQAINLKLPLDQYSSLFCPEFRAWRSTRPLWISGVSGVSAAAAVVISSPELCTSLDKVQKEKLHWTAATAAVVGAARTEEWGNYCCCCIFFLYVIFTVSSTLSFLLIWRPCMHSLLQFACHFGHGFRICGGHLQQYWIWTI